MEAYGDSLAREMLVKMLDEALEAGNAPVQ
jgi:hypothetical protein